MELQLTLTRTKGHELPLNYQYPLSAWVYRVIARANADYATFLHGQGHVSDGKAFKLFTFSDLKTGLFRIQGDRLCLLEDRATLSLRFMMEPSQQHFVVGLLEDRQLELGDGKSSVSFTIGEIMTQPKPLFLKKMHYRSLSPLCLTTKIEARKHAQYCAPTMPEYGAQLLNNLVHKHHAMKAALADATEEQPSGEGKFRLLSTPRSRLVTVKAGTPAETKIRGFLFDFEMTLPTELHEIGYYAGFGEKNSMGFGCVGLRH